MSNLYKRQGSPYYYGIVKGHRFSTGTNKKMEALRVLEKKERELWERQHDLIDNSNKPAFEFFERYLKWIKLNRRYHTYRSYRSIIGVFKRYFESKGGIMRLKHISSMLFEEYIMHRLKVSKRWSVNNHIIALKAMFNKAFEWHYIGKNPATKQSKVEVNDSKRIRCLSEEEYIRFLETCKSCYPECYSMFCAFLTTGMRAGELFNLEWSDIDFNHSVIYIRIKPGFAPKGKDHRANRAKERMIPLHPKLKNILLKVPKISSYIFTDGGNPFSKQKPRRLLIRIAKRSNIQGLTRLHELRHTYASLLLSKGVHIFALKELLGHSDIRETQKYSLIIPEHLKLTTELISKINLVDSD